MNYLRGALSAASQYYKDLPPINPSTLTGAIDVIVIERPAEDGGAELACSPFHVRFGKWQILRPGEKKVKVLVNGHPIPFDMKIGDAGEAFFVFETDEDVPAELITSPLLQPTKVGQNDNHAEEQMGRFGAEDERGEDKMVRPTQGEEAAPQEPDFLDLDAPRTENTDKVTLDIAKPSEMRSSSSGLSRTRPPGVLMSQFPPSQSGDGGSTSVSSSMSEAARRVGVTVPDDTLEDERYKAGSLLEKAAAVRHLATRSDGHHPKNDGDLHEGAGDDVLPPVDDRDAQPPEVTYHHDVVLDASGYHSRDVSDRTIVATDDDLNTRPKTPRQSDVSLNIITPPPDSRTPSPESSDDMSAPRMIRGGSEPPEYGASSVPSSSPPPEYSWEWGAFPQRSPVKQKFAAEDSDLPHRISFPPKSLDVMGETRAPSPPRTRSPLYEAAFADGGRLEGDIEDPYRIWLEFEGQRLAFEVSLCGDAVRGEEAVEDARYFDADRVTFTRLLEDPDIVQSNSLVVRWDEEYICRRDNSPLMSALAGWRQRSLSPPTSPRPYSETANERTTFLAAPRPQPSTWSRWWSRNRTLPEVKEAASSEQDTKSEQGPLHAKRPSLDHSSSAPVDTVPLDPNATALPQSSVPFPSAAPAESSRTKYAKTLRLTSDQLKALNLNKGANSITFSLSASGQVACTARIFLWEATDHILVSDIDGTITKSDALGHVFTMIGRDWTHLGVAKLYTDICRNGYKIMYLTSRAIGQADSTRDYLKGINQNNYQLPEGPVIMSPDRLLTSLHREVIMRKPELFKMACLRDIQRLFGTSSHKPFYAGFGNRITDALSYRSVNIPSARIFTIDSTGEVKMELLELAGYKSSYIHMTDIVDQIFPPIHRKCAPEYTDFNYWRNPVQEYELPEALTAPPSPTLSASARSDVSNQSALSRLRQFSLGRSTSRGGGSGSSTPASRSPSSHVRTLSSLSDFATGANWNGKGKDKENGYREITRTRFHSGDFDFGDSDRTGRSRKRFENNMPGSLPGSMEDKIWGMRDPRWSKDRDLEEGVGDEETGEEGYDDDGDDGEEEMEDEEDAEEAAEEAFDDDLLATGEMEKVPFL